MAATCKYGSRIITHPDAAQEILTVAEIKKNFDIDRDDQDGMLSRYLAAAIAQVQDRTNRQLVTATWELTLDRFPRGPIMLPRNPVSAITWVKYTDTDGTLQTLDAADYQAVYSREPAEIVPIYATSWPATRQQPEAVNVRYTCGYGSAAAVPAIYKELLLLIVGGFYEFRESHVAEPGLVQVLDNPAVQQLMNAVDYGDAFFDFAECCG